MFPVATVALLVFLLTLPFLLLFAARQWRVWKAGGAGLDRAKLRDRDRLVFRVFAAGTVLALAVGIALVVLGLRIGVGDRASGVLDFDDGNVVDGARVHARAWVVSNRVGFYQERFLLVGRELFVVPLTGEETDTDLQIFMEVPRPQAAQGGNAETIVPSRREITGVIRRAALPGGLERLYRNAGYDVKRPTYVVFEDLASARWPYFSAAADFAIFALLLALCGGAMAWHLRRLKLAKGLGHQSTQK